MIAIMSLPLILGFLGSDDRSTPGQGTKPAPGGWRSDAPRAELAPIFRVEKPELSDARAAYILVQKSRGDASVDGRWLRTIQVKADTHYMFVAEYQARNVTNPERSVLARVIWLDDQGRQLEFPEYPIESPNHNRDGWTVLLGTYLAPAKAQQAQIELHLRWAPRGEVRWRAADLTATALPIRRIVRLASANHRPKSTRNPEKNLEEFAKLVNEAAERRADIVCLPEGITVVGNGKTYAEAADAIPGPSTLFLGELARKHRLYLVAGLYEREDKAIYNTSVLIGRDGSLIGKYRKVCLPREEIDGGITPGHEYPVFDTDFGRVGMMICWDVSYPEVARALARRGAEVICMPIWGGNETLARARAIENQLYLVASGYDFKSAIFDKTGHPLAEATTDPSVLVTQVDLNERALWPWLGDWRSRIWREGPPLPEPGH
jgi:predicted amidohydrolase